MTERLRRAGTGRLPDGGIVAWSVADGGRGRRWRWTVTDGGTLRHAGLIELDPAGRFSRLELSSRVGLLTLHPDPDGRSIHGNVVTAEGVRPLAFAWQPRAGVELAADAFATGILPAGAQRGLAPRPIEPRRRRGRRLGAAPARRPGRAAFGRCPGVAARGVIAGAAAVRAATIRGNPVDNVVRNDHRVSKLVDNPSSQDVGTARTVGLA
jgi:hypothetical protein